jgi:hypothetical protein
LVIHRVPVRHGIRVRTTNLAERSFEEERRRTKVIPRLMTERATLKLVFVTMFRAASRWCRVSINDIERHQLRLLRAQLGLDPPSRRSTSPTKEKTGPHRRMKAAALVYRTTKLDRRPLGLLYREIRRRSWGPPFLAWA